MTRPVRYQKGELYQEYGARFVRYRERVHHTDGSIKFRRRAKRSRRYSWNHGADCGGVRVL